MALVSSWRDWLLLEILGPGPRVLSLRILVHTLGKLYLPPSLFRDGCVTLMCIYGFLDPMLKPFGFNFQNLVSSIDILWSGWSKCTWRETSDVTEVGLLCSKKLCFNDFSVSPMYVAGHLSHDGSIRTKVFRKKTHTDQYLDFNSNHPLEHKRGVARTLLHHATMVVSDRAELQKEKDYIRNALHLNGYPDWVIHQGDHSTPTNTPLDNTSTIHENEDNDHISLHPPQTVSYTKRKFLVVIPYIKGVSEELRRLFKRYEVPMYFKPTNILRQLLVSPKDKMKKERVIGPVYQISCEKCPATCIGETERSVKQRFLEHRRSSSASSKVSRQVQYIYGWHQHFGGWIQIVWAWGQGICVYHLMWSILFL